MATFQDFIVKNGLVVTEGATISQAITVGQDATINGITVGEGPVTNNLVYGVSPLANNVTGQNNIAIGNNAGQAVTGSNNVILGNFTGNSNGLDISSSDGNIVLADGLGVPKFLINAQGYIGVNNLNPTVELEVGGDVKATNIEAATLNLTGDITVGGTINADDFLFTGPFFTLNEDLSNQVVPFEDAGLIVNRGAEPDVSFFWDEDNDYWTTGTDPNTAQLAELEAYIDGGVY